MECSPQFIAGHLEMEGELSKPILLWLQKHGWESPQRVLGGRNNQIYRVVGSRGTAALKIHFHGPADSRKRWAAEKAFYSHVAACKASAPQWLAGEEGLNVSLLTWIEGEPLQTPIRPEDVAWAGSFLQAINKNASPAILPESLASEACFSVQEHILLLEGRIKRMEEASDRSSPLALFMAKQLAPFAKRVFENLKKQPQAEFKKHNFRRIYSPGDFGFHNALREKSGRIVFFDFEYAGWDDPAKTVADIFLQPEKPVAAELLPLFLKNLPEWGGLEERVRIWIPFFAAKWAVILLSAAVPTTDQRRKFAGELPAEDMLHRQIDKAAAVLARSGNFSI